LSGEIVTKHDGADTILASAQNRVELARRNFADAGKAVPRKIALRASHAPALWNCGNPILLALGPM
jgi:hypothetical protein